MTNEPTRRDALHCMLWAGAGVVWTLVGGVPRSTLLGSPALAETRHAFRFAQISDSHIGFAKAPNMDTAGTLAAAIDAVRANAGASLLLHTGDITHLSRAGQFDTADQIIRGGGL